MCLWLLLTQLQTGGLIGYIQPNQTCWIVLLNILSPFLYQFSTKLAWSTRDVAELGSGRGGAAIIALHFTIIVKSVVCLMSSRGKRVQRVCPVLPVINVSKVHCGPALFQWHVQRGYTAPYRPGSLWHTVYSWAETRVLRALCDIMLCEPLSTLCVHGRALHRLGAL